MSQPWYKSKTKVGAVIAGTGAILTTVGLFLQDKIDLVTAIPLIITELGAIWVIVGARNAIAKNGS